MSTRTPVRALTVFALLTGGLASAAHASPVHGYVGGPTPLGYLYGFGPKAGPVVTLTWALIGLSTFVVLVISALVVTAIMRRRWRDSTTIAPVERGRAGLGWIAWGLGISSIGLLGSLLWTVVVLADVNGPPSKPTVTIEVTGQQWWWKARYLNKDVSRTFTTAGEIHIPVGKPVQIRLVGADVIHSFWIPALGGKLEAIPGQTNVTWLEASRAGRYRGACSEYCGKQHAHMEFEVVAQPPADYAAWVDQQIKPASPPSSPELARDEHAFVYHCGACHAVRGTEAGGTVAPDLTHLMSRSILAGGVVPNTIGNLSGWIANPQGLKPGTHMPTLYLSGPQLQDVRTYLETLR